MIIKKIKALFHNSKKPSLKEKVSSALFLLESTSNRLKVFSERLKNRDQKFFEKCIEEEIANNHERAIMYANECAEVRKFARLLISSELVLEQASLRLQTITKLDDVITTITPIVEIVETTKGKLVGIVPSVANQLNDINSMLKNSFQVLGSAQTNAVSNNSNEAMKILSEANLAAEEEIRERFPTLPEELQTSEKLAEYRVLEALVATGGSSGNEGKDLKNEVLEYCRKFNGHFSISQCATSLGIPTIDVEKTLLELKEEGHIE